MAGKRVSVRLVAEGGRRVRSEFQGVGEAGEASFKRIEKQADINSKVMGVLGAAISVQQRVTWTDLRSRVDLATGSRVRPSCSDSQRWRGNLFRHRADDGLLAGQCHGTQGTRAIDEGESGFYRGA